MIEFGTISPLDQDASQAAQQSLRDGAASAGAGASGLESFAELAGWLARTNAPASLDRVELAIVAGERDVPDVVSTLPQGTAQSVSELFASGRSPIYATASAQGVSVSFLDATRSHPSLNSTESDGVEAAGESEMFTAAMKRGMDYADRQADEGVQLILLGDVGRGLTTTAAAMIGTLCSIEPVKVIGWGSGISDDGWREKVKLIRDDMFSVRDDRADAWRVLVGIGTPDIAVMAGILAQSAVRRTPVVFDGVGATAAALCAQVMAPGVNQWWRPAGPGTEPAISPALNALQLQPIMPTRIGFGQGTATLMALPMLRFATECGGAELGEPGA